MIARTERCPLLHIMPKQIPGADRGQLRKLLDKPLRLSALPDSRRPHKDDSSGFSEAHASGVGDVGAVCTDRGQDVGR